MPEKASVPGFDKCNKCFSASEGAAQGPSQATHADICCFYRLCHQGQYAKDGSKVCPRLTVQTQRGGCPAPKTPEARSVPPQDGTGTPYLGVGGVTESQPRKRKTIEPRLRSGFKNFTIEVRPTRFKKKLWFGTYTRDELNRARDAVNYYMGCNQKYTYPDSPRIFESKPLKGIKFEDLQPSCDDWITLDDGKRELRYKYFARQVKEVIHSVTGKKKKSVGSLSKRNKCKESQSPPDSGLRDPTMPSGAGITTSSGTREHQLAWYRSLEENSDLSAMHQSFLLPEMLTYGKFSELLSSGSQRDDMAADGYSSEEMFTPLHFSNGECSSMDEEKFLSEILGPFPNEGLP